MLRNSSFFVKFPARIEQSGAAAAMLDCILIKNVLVGCFLGYFEHQIGFMYDITGFMDTGIKEFEIV